MITSGEVSPQIGYFAAVIFRNRGRRDLARQLLQNSLSSYIAFPEQEAAKQLLKEIQAESATDGVEGHSTIPDSQRNNSRGVTDKATSRSTNPGPE